MLRIATGLVVIRCPHRLGERLSRRKSHGHVQFFNKAWFYNFADLNGLSVDVETSKWLHILHEYIALFRVPLEITVSRKLV